MEWIAVCLDILRKIGMLSCCWLVLFLYRVQYSLFLTYIQQALNSSLGDWLSFYGAIIGIGISFLSSIFNYLLTKRNLESVRDQRCFRL